MSGSTPGIAPDRAVFEVKAKRIGLVDSRRTSICRLAFPTGWILIGICGPHSVEVAVNPGASPQAVRGATFEPRGAVTVREVMEWQDRPGQVLARGNGFTYVERDGYVRSRGDAAEGKRCALFGDLDYFRMSSTLSGFRAGLDLTAAGREVVPTSALAP